MKNTIFKLISVILTITCVLTFASCSKGTDESETTTKAPASESTSATSEESSTQQATLASEDSTDESETQSTSEATTEATTKATATTTARADQSVSVNEALNVLSEHYGSSYDVNGTVSEGDYYYFAVYDKNGDKYASVKVNLKNSNATETIINTGKTNEFNLFD